MSFNFFGLTFHIYGLILGLAILAAFQASVWCAKLKKYDFKIVEELFWWVVGGGIIGARIYHVVDKWQTIYRFNPVSILYVWNGGLGIWGAVLGGIVGLFLFLQKTQRFKNSKIQKKENPKSPNFVGLLDITLCGVPLGQAIGRWGNYFNNEIVGKNGEPLFFYESMLDLLLFLILFMVAKKVKKTGVISGVYLIGYGVIRFFLETLRPDAMVWKIGTVPAAQVFSVGAIIVGTYFILGRRS